jgi:hypothetical protein
MTNARSLSRYRASCGFVVPQEGSIWPRLWRRVSVIQVVRSYLLTMVKAKNSLWTAPQTKQPTVIGCGHQLRGLRECPFVTSPVPPHHSARTSSTARPNRLTAHFRAEAIASRSRPRIRTVRPLQIQLQTPSGRFNIDSESRHTPRPPRGCSERKGNLQATTSGQAPGLSWVQGRPTITLAIDSQ